MMDKLGIIIPIYNEEGAIASVLDKWRKALDRLCIDYYIYVYNDGSNDNSLAILCAQKSLFNGRLVVVDKQNSGHGPTILSGYRKAVEDGCKWVFQVDSDDEISPEYFADLWAARNDYDFVVGRRRHGPRTWIRRVVSSVSRFVVRLFYGSGVYDVNVPYRLMRANAFKPIFDALPDYLFAPNVVIAGMAARCGLRYFEIPVDVHYRATGVCSLNHVKLLSAAIRSSVQTVSCAFCGRMRVTALTWSAVLLGLFCMGTNPFINAMRGIDEAVFVYVGQAIRRGLLPYRDVFDHKGPLLYLFNYLGLTIGNGETWGIWLIECVLLIVGCVVLMRMAESLFHITCSRFAIFPYLILLFCSTCSGNICETYSIFFIIIAMAALFKGIEKRLHSFVFGICLASIMMMKFVTVGIAAVWGWLLIEALLRKKYAVTFRAVASAVVGFAVVVVPFLIYLGVYGILDDFWDVYVLFNMSYGRNCTFNSNYHFFNRATIPVVVALILNILAVLRNHDVTLKRIMKLNLVLLIVSALLVVGANAGCSYYYLPVYPACFLPFAYLSAMGGEWTQTRKLLANVLACIGIGFLLFLDFRAAVYVTPYVKSLLNGQSFISVLQQIRIVQFNEVSAFKKYIEDASSVTVLGNNCQVYRTLGVTTPWRYPYQKPIYRMRDDVGDDIERLIRAGKSRYLVVNLHEKALIKRYGRDIRKHYTEIANTQSYTLWERRCGPNL